jgi:hypothetical protein
MNNIPTLEQFTQAVKKHFCKLLPQITEKEADKYLASDEATQEIENAYNENIGDVKDGSITAETLLQARTSAVGYCLSLMYE